MLGFGGIPVITIGAYDLGMALSITYMPNSRLVETGGSWNGKVAELGVLLIYDNGDYIGYDAGYPIDWSP